MLCSISQVSVAIYDSREVRPHCLQYFCAGDEAPVVAAGHQERPQSSRVEKVRAAVSLSAVRELRKVAGPALEIVLRHTVEKVLRSSSENHPGTQVDTTGFPRLVLQTENLLPSPDILRGVATHIAPHHNHTLGRVPAHMVVPRLQESIGFVVHTETILTCK